MEHESLDRELLSYNSVSRNAEYILKDIVITLASQSCQSCSSPSNTNTLQLQN